MRPNKFFYLNGKLHKILRIERARDLVECYVYSEKKRVLYAWTAVRKNRRPSFRRAQVAKMLNRHPVVISRYIEQGVIPAPELSHELTTGKPGDYYWSEEDVLALHSYLLELHRGRPRKDGRITTWHIPSRAELIAMMRTEQVLYVKNKDGEFVPVWRAEDW